MERTPLFPLGHVFITPGAAEILTLVDIGIALHRHQCGEWGELADEDRQQNVRGLSNCGMIMSVYQTANGVLFWVQTHGTRSHTTILLPGE